MTIPPLVICAASLSPHSPFRFSSLPFSAVIHAVAVVCHSLFYHQLWISVHFLLIQNLGLRLFGAFYRVRGSRTVISVCSNQI